MGFSILPCIILFHLIPQSTNKNYENKLKEAKKKKNYKKK